MKTIELVTALGRAIHHYRTDWSTCDDKAARLVGSMQAVLTSLGLTQLDPPKNVTDSVYAVESTKALSHTYHGRSAHEAAIRAAAEEIANWADPPRQEKSDTDASAIVAEKAAE